MRDAHPETPRITKTRNVTNHEPEKITQNRRD